MENVACGGGVFRQCAVSGISGPGLAEAGHTGYFMDSNLQDPGAE